MKIEAGKKRKRTKTKGMLCLAVMIGCLWSGVVAEAAEEVNGPIPIDNFTGEAKTNVQTEKEEITISSKCVYDTVTQEFVYTVDEVSKLQVRSSVADGMFTNYSVSLDIRNKMDFTLYQDGAKVEAPDFSSIEQVGSYVLHYKGKKVLEFRILGAYSTVEMFYAPKGFYIKDALLNGAPAQFSSGGVELIGEGLYEIFYECEATSRTYSFRIQVDKTAPVLVLEGLDEKGRASGPVDISNREADSMIKIILDGKEQEVTDLLTKSGYYTVTIFDDAGNYNSYDFTILLYFNTNSVTFLALVFVVVGGIVAYIIVSSKKLKVF